MKGGIVGRDDVVGDIWRALSARSPVVLGGPAGIGKTEVWRAVRAEAERRDWLALVCGPAETEAALPFAALADLLAPLADQVPVLPQPQRTAAEVVLLSSPAAQDVDERTVGAATRTLLAAAAGGPRPVLLAIDDAQWLDRPSERALRFALRRVSGLALLVTHRTSGAAGDPDDPDLAGVPLGLDRDAADEPMVRIGLRPLGAHALRQMLSSRVGARLSRPLLARVAREADGNPLLTLELARAVLRLEHRPMPTADLPVAASMRQLVADALAALPPSTTRAVRVAALLGVPLWSDLSNMGIAATDLEPAEEGGLVSMTPEAVRFAHPVYAAAVRSSIPVGTRRRLHRELAGVVCDPDERARHLARCTVQPDAVVAEELAGAAARLRARGAPEFAAEMYDAAARLTPPSAEQDAGNRRLAAARCLFDGGDYAAAGAAAEAAAEELQGSLRGESLLLRAVVAWCADDLQVAVSAAELALSTVDPGSPLAGRVHAHLALFRDLPEHARRHAEAAIAALRASDADRDMLSAALLLLFFNEVRAGLPARTELLDQALLLEAEEPSWLAGTVPAVWWKAVDEHDRARDKLEGLLRRATAQGNEPWQHELLTHLGEAELLSGRFEAAERAITAARQLGEQLGTGLAGEMWLMGMLHAHRGDLDAAREIAEAGKRRAEDLDDAWCRRINLQLAGFVELSTGRMVEAAAAYGDLAAIADRFRLVPWDRWRQFALYNRSSCR